MEGRKYIFVLHSAVLFSKINDSFSIFTTDLVEAYENAQDPATRI